MTDFQSVKGDYYNQFINVFIGTGDFTAADVLEREGVAPVAPDFLNDIEYVADIHLKESAFDDSLMNVGMVGSVTYRDENDAVRFGPENLTMDDMRFFDATDEATFRTFHLTDGPSFALRTGAEILGRMPTTLKAKFVANLDTSVDPIALPAEAVGVDSDGLPTSNVAPITIEFGQLSDADYDNYNLASAILAKATGAQMQATGGDESLMRVMVEPTEYNNLLRFPLGGAVNTSNVVTSLHQLLVSKVDTPATKYTPAELDNQAVNAAPSQRPLGHEVMLAIHRAFPPNPLNTELNPSAPHDKLYTLTTGVPDASTTSGTTAVLTLNKLPTDKVNMQFLLKTSLTMRLRKYGPAEGDVGTVTTLPSPPTPFGEEATGPEPANRLFVLFNLIFDRQ